MLYLELLLFGALFTFSVRWVCRFSAVNPVGAIPPDLSSINARCHPGGMPGSWIGGSAMTDASLCPCWDGRLAACGMFGDIYGAREDALALLISSSRSVDDERWLASGMHLFPARECSVRHRLSRSASIGLRRALHHQSFVSSVDGNAFVLLCKAQAQEDARVSEKPLRDTFRVGLPRHIVFRIVVQHRLRYSSLHRVAAVISVLPAV